MSIASVKRIIVLSVTASSDGVATVTVINPKTGQHFEITRTGSKHAHEPLAALCQLLLEAESDR